MHHENALSQRDGNARRRSPAQRGSGQQTKWWNTASDRQGRRIKLYIQETLLFPFPGQSSLSVGESMPMKFLCNSLAASHLSHEADPRRMGYAERARCDLPDQAPGRSLRRMWQKAICCKPGSKHQRSPTMAGLPTSQWRSFQRSSACNSASPIGSCVQLGSPWHGPRCRERARSSLCLVN